MFSENREALPGTQDYKIKVEYGVSAIVLLVGVFFIFQAFTIRDLA